MHHPSSMYMNIAILRRTRNRNKAGNSFFNAIKSIRTVHFYRLRMQTDSGQIMNDVIQLPFDKPKANYNK